MKKEKKLAKRHISSKMTTKANKKINKIIAKIDKIRENSQTRSKEITIKYIEAEIREQKVIKKYTNST